MLKCDNYDNHNNDNDNDKHDDCYDIHDNGEQYLNFTRMWQWAREASFLTAHVQPYGYEQCSLCSVCSGSFLAFWLFQGEVTAHSRKYDDDNDDIYDNDNNDNDDNVGYV